MSGHDIDLFPSCPAHTGSRSTIKTSRRPASRRRGRVAYWYGPSGAASAPLDHYAIRLAAASFTTPPPERYLLRAAAMT